jgi:hypothetical protein
VHYYNYDALCTDVTTFPKARFASEYGFQSFPSFISLLPVSQPGDWYATSPLMEHRQHHPNGTQQLIDQMAVCWLLGYARIDPRQCVHHELTVDHDCHRAGALYNTAKRQLDHQL